MWGTSFVCKLDAFNWVDSFVLAALVATVLVAEKYAFQSLSKTM